MQRSVYPVLPSPIAALNDQVSAGPGQADDERCVQAQQEPLGQNPEDFRVYVQ